ncbi:homoserine kinase [Salinimonas marina]|uniref:Homoserine kinase n=1 Tax=Salinimonas marina TaxID=2785918 RepID=A0A7S9HE42_9ALTE|nr:homoserine kinase [Salinimonas marina]QPG06256.1 homoserine kinase [Salinimonas marina]
MTTIAYAPASIGNISLGYDVLGAAIEPVDGTPLGDVVEVQQAEAFSLSVDGPFAHKLPRHENTNIVTHCYEHFIEAMVKYGQPTHPVALTLHKNLPIGSGLGSSASSIVAALHALNIHFGQPFTKNELLHMMGEMEGQISGSIHYDNVAPSYLGGITLMTGQQAPLTASLPAINSWYWVVCYSGITVSTSQARDILPDSVPLATGLTFGRQLGVFVHALHTQDEALAAAVMTDVIAEPYRKSLLPGFDEARIHCLRAGALAFGISGSGPTVFAVCQKLEEARSMAAWLETNYIQNDDGFSHVCRIPSKGVK